MSLKIVFKELALVLDTNLEYMSTKTDKYENEYSYYSILNDNIKNIATKQIIYHCVDKKGDDCLWGDEVEYTILNNDNTPNKKCFEYISNIDSKQTK